MTVEVSREAHTGSDTAPTGQTGAIDMKWKMR
jgi:hypothetical protein